MSMDFFDILFAKKNAPLPENGYLKTEVVSYPATALSAEQLPIPKCDVAITNQKQCQVIVSDVPVFDNDEPYLFRESAGGNNILEKKLTGVTIANTQHARNGNFASNSNWASSSLRSAFSIADNVATIYDIVGNDAYFNQTGIPFLLNHKYLIKIDAKCTNAMTLNTAVFTANFTSVASFSRILTTDYTTVGSIINCSNANASQVAFTLNGAFDENTVANFRNAQIIDLTQMLGITIADYIYNMEQSTAGSGISWLKNYCFLKNGYYQYSAGSLQSVKTSGKKVVGKNLFDKSATDTSNGFVEDNAIIGTTGALSPNNTTNVSEYIKVIAGKTYTIHGVTGNAAGICFYDYDKTFIKGTNYSNSSAVTVTAPANAAYARFSIYKQNAGIIQLEIGSTATLYEQYISITYQLGNDELRGVPKLVNNVLTYDGDTKSADGVITRKYGIVDLGTLTWTANVAGNYTRFGTTGTNVKPASNNSVVANIICSKYTADNFEAAYAGTRDKIVAISNGGSINVVDSGYSDAATFKTAMSGVYLLYELAAQTTELSTPYTEIQMVYEGGTEEFVDTRDVPVPVGHESTYYNGQAYITDFDNPTTGIIHMAELHSIVPPSGEFYIESNGTVDVDVWKK